jgi:MFS family permease
VRGRRTFAILGVGLAIVGAVGTAIVQYSSSAPVVGAFGFGEAAMVGYVIEGLTWASIGAVLVLRRPENAVGWLMVLVGVGYSLSQLTVSMTFAFAAERTAQGDRLAQVAGWVTVLLQLVAILQIAIGFLFPTGRAQSPGWGWFMRLFWGMSILFVVISLTQPGSLQLIPDIDNPFGFGPDLRNGRPIAPILALWTLIIFAGLGVSMVSRYRSAGHVERLQMKWFVLALSVSAVALGIATWESVFTNIQAGGTFLTAYVFAGALVPIAIGIAMLRHHLYDIDRLISRTLGYGIVTGLLAAVFAVTAIGLSALLGSLAQGESLAVAAATLLVVALFGPLRRRAQSVIDRRFDRARYDASLTVQSLTARLRDDVDIDRVQTHVLGVVDGTFHPSSTGMWLRRGSR